MKEKLDPIIAVKDVAVSSRWYQEVFGFENAHPNGHFALLKSKNSKIVLCLHPWEMDDHPTMRDPDIPVGNGLILYYKTDKLDEIRANAKRANAKIDEDIHINPRPSKREFSLWDPDGYYWIVTEYHEYEG